MLALRRRRRAAPPGLGAGRLLPRACRTTRWRCCSAPPSSMRCWPWQWDCAPSAATSASRPAPSASRTRSGRRSRTPAACAISMAARSAATTRTTARPTAAGSITIWPSTASCCASPRPARPRFYHYLAGREAPYAWWDLPVVLGTLGGIGLVIGSAGLLAAKLQRDPALLDEQRPRHGHRLHRRPLPAPASPAWLLLLFRATPAMNMLLAIHLGFVFAFFLDNAVQQIRARAVSFRRTGPLRSRAAGHAG